MTRTVLLPWSTPQEPIQTIEIVTSKMTNRSPGYTAVIEIVSRRIYDANQKKRRQWLVRYAVWLYSGSRRGNHRRVRNSLPISRHLHWLLYITVDAKPRFAFISSLVHTERFYNVYENDQADWGE